MKSAKEKRESEFLALFGRAHEAGMRALDATRPTPMVVSQHASPIDNASPVVQQWYEPEGMCGFAWVVVRPGTSSFARWLTKTKRARPAYRGGVSIWVNGSTQSIQRKESYARAFAAVLKEAGINAYSDSRLD